MYQFKSIKNENLICGTSRITNLYLFPEYNEVQIMGRLKTLFGEPVYETNNYENAYLYVIEAVDSISVDYPLYFTVYQGPSGCAVGASINCEEIRNAIGQFKELLLKTKPSDFMYEGYYMDDYMRIKSGICDGKFIFEEEALDEDEIETVWKEWGLKLS